MDAIQILSQHIAGAIEQIVKVQVERQVEVVMRSLLSDPISPLSHAITEAVQQQLVAVTEDPDSPLVKELDRMVDKAVSDAYDGGDFRDAVTDIVENMDLRVSISR